MSSGYVATYNGQTGQNLSGGITIRNVSYAQTPFLLSPSQMDYGTIGSLLTFTPLESEVNIPLGKAVDLPPIVRDPNQSLVLRYTTEFTGDEYATSNRLLRVSEASPTPEPSTLTLLALGAVFMLGYAWRRRPRVA